MGSNSNISNFAEEDYIDMEVSTSSSNFFYSPPQQTREFEFQKMFSTSHDKSQATASPADELFYKGKLLPLHLPPRLQMVHSLIENSNTPTIDEKKIDSSVNESCDISPCESRKVSSELNQDEYFFEWSTEVTGFVTDKPKHSWSKKLKLIKIKDSSLGQKLKALSRSYLKSFFTKSSCSNETCVKPSSCNANTEPISESNTKECLYKHIKVSDYVLKITNKEMGHDQNGDLNNNNSIFHRKSFSGAIKRHSATKGLSSTSSSGSSSSSSSFSFSLDRCYDLQLLKRSISANSEIENSIEGAIAHCKQSQQLLNSKKTIHEVSLCSLSASRTSMCGDKDGPGIYSI